MKIMNTLHFVYWIIRMEFMKSVINPIFKLAPFNNSFPFPFVRQNGIFGIWVNMTLCAIQIVFFSFFIFFFIRD